MGHKLTEGNINKCLIVYAVPLIIAYTIQGLYRMTDSMLVANWLGSKGLAVMGIVTNFTFALMNVACGFGIGAGVLIAQRFGAEKYMEMKRIIHNSIQIAICLSVLLSAIFIIFMESVMIWLNVPLDIKDSVKEYLYIYLGGYFFIMMNNLMISIFNSLGKSRIPLLINTIGAVINVAMDVLFITILKLQIMGAIIPLIVVQGMEMLVELVVLRKLLSKFPILKTYEMRERFHTEILKLSLPCIFQYGAVSIGSVILQRLVNTFGTDILAGYAAGTRIDDIALCILTNASTVAAAFTAQNYGANKVERIRKGIKACFYGIVIISLAIMAIILPGRVLFIKIFAGMNAGKVVIETGCVYLKVTSLFYMMLGIMYLYQGALCGVGETKFSMFSTVANFSVRLVMAYILAPKFGITGVLVSLPMGWCIGTLIAKLRFEQKMVSSLSAGERQ